MRLSTTLVSLLLYLSSLIHGEAVPSPVAPKPCQIRSPSTGSFFDLRPLELHPKPLPSPTTTRSASGTASTSTASASPLPKPESYHSRGYDYPANFTLNICGAVVEPLLDVQGIPKTRWANISAYYKDSDGSIQSLGQQNAHPIFRGRKLLLNYTQGSPCPDLDEDGRPMDILSNTLSITAKKTNRYKSTLLTFTCDTSPSLTNHPVISFLGSPDHCSYVFEVRSRYACAGAGGPPTDSNSLSPTGVFFVILAIAVMVYLVGGCVYQRSVMHQRGWRQCPNFGVWAGIFGFVGVSLSFVLRICGFARKRGGEGGGRYGYLNDDDERGSNQNGEDEEGQAGWLPQRRY